MTLRLDMNTTDKARRLMYLTYGMASEGKSEYIVNSLTSAALILAGDFRARYYADKRKNFPPDCERSADKVYQYKI